MSDDKRTVTARDIAEALGRGKEKKSGRGWMTFCCAHDDRTKPALSVTESSSGKIMVFCHAGCPSASVITELRRLELWPSTHRMNWVPVMRAPDKAVPVAMKHYKLGNFTRKWDYYDAEGRLRGSVCRFEEVASSGKISKTIIPATWCREEKSGDESWQWKGMVEPRCLYRELEIVSNPRKHVLLVEGEKSADSAQKLLGEVYEVGAWAGGAKAYSKTDFKHLRGRDVTLWPDADSPGDEAMRNVAEILLDIGAKTVRRVSVPTPEELVMMGVPVEDAVGWDLGDEIPERMDVAALLHNAKIYEPVGDEVVDRFNRDFAMVLVGGQAVVLHEARDVAGNVSVNYLSTGSFREFYGNKMVVQGKQTVPESHYWLKHPERRSYERVAFDPNNAPPRSYNLWRGFSVEPDPTGSWDLLQEHLLLNMARGDESLARWITGWFAHLIQHPEKKLGTSLAARGRQGTGKTVLGQLMGQLYKPHYVLVDKPHYVTGQFNAHMSSCLLLHADEAFFAGNPATVGQLRGLVTGDTIRVEHKGKDSFELKNYLRLYASSNNSWIVPAGFEERRFAVIDVGEGRMQDKPFFEEMAREMNDGGYAAMLDDLLKFDLTTVDVGRVPQTLALQDQKFHSMDPVARYWYDRLHEAEPSNWPSSMVVEDEHQAYVDVVTRWGEPRRLDKYSFSRELKRFWPDSAGEQVRAKARKGPSGKTSRPWAVTTGTLDQHRRRFSEVLGGQVDWIEEADEPDVGVGRQGRLT